MLQDLPDDPNVSIRWLWKLFFWFSLILKGHATWRCLQFELYTPACTHFVSESSSISRAAGPPLSPSQESFTESSEFAPPSPVYRKTTVLYMGYIWRRRLYNSETPVSRWPYYLIIYSDNSMSPPIIIIAIRHCRISTHRSNQQIRNGHLRRAHLSLASLTRVRALRARG